MVSYDHALSKKRKLTEINSTNALHTLQSNVLPSGNAFFAENASVEENRLEMGSWASLPDSLILSILSILEYKDLCLLEQTNKSFFVFINTEELWKNKYILEFSEMREWKGNWRRTYAYRRGFRRSNFSGLHHKIYSDTLYRGFLPLTDINIQQSRPNIKRFANSIDHETFLQFADTPFIIGHDFPELTKDLFDSDTLFRAEALKVSMPAYIDYCHSNDDIEKIYLFDKSILMTIAMQKLFPSPAYFGSDYFDVLSDLKIGKLKRPDNRWLIAGQKGSGSTWHKDPNSTSAWNALLHSDNPHTAKLWLLFPPKTIPPGVFVSPDEGHVTTPLSIHDWFRDFYKESILTKGLIQGVCRQGELVYVPPGWWHCVLNIGEGMSWAITQNFVNATNDNLSAVLKFLKEKNDQLSGFYLSDDEDEAQVDDEIYNHFVKSMERRYPNALKEALSIAVREVRKPKKSSVFESDGAKSFSFDFEGDE